MFSPDSALLLLNQMFARKFFKRKLRILKAIFFRNQDAYDACQAHNSGVFEDCIASCEDSRCQAICLENNQLAMDNCPCSTNCPNGCDGCQSTFCGACDNPQANDVNYQVCVDKNSGFLDFCLKQCSNDPTCHRTCYDEFESNLEDCPCMKNCPNGCPCEDSTKARHSSFPKNKVFL